MLDKIYSLYETELGRELYGEEAHLLELIHGDYEPVLEADIYTIEELESLMRFSPFMNLDYYYVPHGWKIDYSIREKILVEEVAEDFHING